MSTADFLRDASQALNDLTYFTHLDVLDQSANILKARLYITPTLFV